MTKFFKVLFAINSIVYTVFTVGVAFFNYELSKSNTVAACLFTVILSLLLVFADVEVTRDDN
jgi:hypothetical protein